MSGGPFKKVKIPKLRYPPGSARISEPRVWTENHNFASKILSAPSTSFRNGMTRSRQPKTLGGFPVKLIFSNKSPAYLIPGSKSPAQKLLAKSVGAPENFGPIRCPVLKLRHFFSVTDTQTDSSTDIQTHGHTDAQTFSNDPPTTKREKKFCLYVWGLLCSTVKHAKFLPFHFLKLCLLRLLASLC
jgi:hypothetical protein